MRDIQLSVECIAFIYVITLDYFIASSSALCARTLRFTSTTKSLSVWQASFQVLSQPTSVFSQTLLITWANLGHLTRVKNSM